MKNMKHVKKLASLLLALVMALALAVPAMAAGETGSITVDNPQKDVTYTAYKIFDVVYSGTNYAYTIKNTNDWYETVKAYAETASNGLTLTAAASDSTTFVVDTNSVKFSAPAFAAALREALERTENPITATGTALTTSGETATATGLELGYYFVTSGTGALCNLTTTNPTVTIHDKNDIPFDKTDDQESVDVGEVVHYVVTGKVPDYTGFKSFTYKLTDKMTEGLTFNKDVEVYVGGTKLTENFTLKTGTDAGEYDFTLDIDVMKLTIGAKIEVKYTATVNEKAVAKIENNHVTLTYSNNPVTGGTSTREDRETVYSAKIVINKVTAGENESKLSGAVFVLYKKVGDAPKYYKWNNESKKVEWVDDKANATSKTTDNDGAASFDGVADGTYYLEETTAPAGYNLLKEPVTVTINGASATAENLSSLTHTEKITNQTGTELPSTGGMGTTLFYAVGGVLVVAAVVLLVTKKRMGGKN